MVAKKNINYKKETVGESKTFGLPFLPLFFFLVLTIVLLALPPRDFLTGNIVNTIEFSQSDYGPAEYLKGNTFMQLMEGDLIPETTEVEFSIEYSNGSTYYQFTLPLKAAISLSETPNYGNYTNGTYRNNGVNLIGEGYGFGHCESPIIPPPIQPPISGEAIAPPPVIPITQPDLTVTAIYSASMGSEPGIAAGPGITPVERLYTKIANIDIGTAWDTFYVEGYWITSDQVAPEKFWTSPAIPGLSAGAEIVLDMGSYALEGKTVRVIVDRANDVLESNEDNNEMTVSFGGVQPNCVDDDNGDPFVYGICHDISQLPFVKDDNCLDDKTLLEYYCPGVSALCQAQQINCSNGCVVGEGRCREQGPSPTCEDTDGGNRPYVFGTCTDDYDSYDDFCPPILPVQGLEQNNIAEYYCYGNNLIRLETCYGCSEPYCGKAPVEGWYANCIEGPRLITEVEAGKCDDQDYVMRFKPICQDVNTPNEGWYTPDVCAVEYSNCLYGCDSSQGACKASNYSCDSWDNVYNIKFSNLNIKTPQARGAYTFTMKLTYKPGALPTTITLASDSKPFNVNSHRACLDVNNCAWVNGLGPDGCDINSDCKGGTGGGGGGGGGSCIESWQYTTWSECVAGQRTRECFDARRCGTTFAKPTYCLPSGTKFVQTQTCVPGCQESWECSEWSYCNQATQEQSSVCEEMNKCNPINYTYIQLRECCSEEWDCTWSSCANGKQQKVCTDLNNCGSEFTKPMAEQRACQGVAWWTWVIIAVVVIGAVLGILYATKVIKFPKKKKAAGEEEAHFTEVKV